VDESYNPGANITNLTFVNTAGTTNFTEARLNYYIPNRSTNSNPPTYANITGADRNDPVQLNITGDNETLNPPLTLQGESTSKIVLKFEGGSVEPGDWYLITFELESGERRLFVVSTNYAGI